MTSSFRVWGVCLSKYDTHCSKYKKYVNDGVLECQQNAEVNIEWPPSPIWSQIININRNKRSVPVDFCYKVKAIIWSTIGVRLTLPNVATSKARKNSVVLRCAIFELPFFTMLIVKRSTKRIFRIEIRLQYF